MIASLTSTSVGGAVGQQSPGPVFEQRHQVTETIQIRRFGNQRGGQSTVQTVEHCEQLLRIGFEQLRLRLGVALRLTGQVIDAVVSRNVLKTGAIASQYTAVMSSTTPRVTMGGTFSMPSFFTPSTVTKSVARLPL